MSIGTVRACSFAELENVTEISFTNVTIAVMEGNAFSNLVNISVLSFVDCIISEMQSHSIHGARDMGALDFRRTNIIRLQPYSVLQIDTIDSIRLDGCHVTDFRYKGITSVVNCASFTVRDCVIDTWHCGSLETFMDNVTAVTVSQSQFTCDCSLAWLWIKHPHQPVISEDSNRCTVSGNRLSTQTVDDVCPEATSRDRGCRPLLQSTPKSCSRKFDRPILPEDKVDYPTYFSPPDNTASLIRSCGLFNGFLVLMFLVTYSV